MADKAVSDFVLPATGGKEFRLSAVKSRLLVLYFYPKDNTPGCITEGAQFRDLYSQFQKAGCSVAGVSRDSLKSHENFKAKMGFPFELLSDEDEKICKQFGVMKMKNMYGKKVRGIERSTFVLRSMPRTFLPYMFFIFITPNCLQIFSSSSYSNSKGKPILAWKFSCDFRLSREFGSERNRLRFRGSSRKKFYELPRQFRRRLLRDVMAAIQGPSLDGFGPLGPVGEGREAARYRCVLAPENEERRDHLAADVGLVVREVDRLGRAVILAAGVNRRRIAKAAPVLRKRLGREGLQARVAGPHVALDVEIRIGADQGLRNRLGPQQEEPVVVCLGELAGDPGIHRARGNDVEHDELRHRGGVVESHAMSDPSAAVVTDDEERFMTQGAHRLDLVLGHGALGIVGMVGKPVGFFAVSVTA